MIFIGEKLNSSVPKTFELMKANDTEKIKELISLQFDAGANYVDLNAGTFTDEKEKLRSLMALVFESFPDAPVMIDSANGKLLGEIVENECPKHCIVNSVTLRERYDEVVPAVKKKLGEGYDISLVAMPVEGKLPGTAEKRRENAAKIIEKLASDGIPQSRVFVDVISEAVAVDDQAAVKLFDTLRFVKENYPETKTVCGLSNISFGLPKRIKLNCSMISIVTYLGIDALITDVISPEVRAAVYSSELLCGKDEFCMNYIDFIRNGYNENK